MKKSILVLVMLFLSLDLMSNGVAVVDAYKPEYLLLKKNLVNIEIENQISIVSNTQTFINNYDDSVEVKYAFPLPEEASAIELKFFFNGQWRITEISPEAQDSTFQGGGGGGGGSTDEIDANFEKYLGTNKVFYELPMKIGSGDEIIFEIKYVEFLKYKMGEVYLDYKNDYSIIQTSEIDTNEFSLLLKSERKILSTIVYTQKEVERYISDNQVIIFIKQYNKPADYDINLKYSLSLDELGLFGMSTYLNNEIDSMGKGYFMFVAEPDPGESTQTLHKNFVLVVDKSGSMSGGSGTNSNKMKDAQQTAHFIVDNLNEGDYFNIISFDNTIGMLSNGLIPFTSENNIAAHSYIDKLTADGGTNISGALADALSLFTVPDENFVNIIIFFTDGEATAGITSTATLVEYVNQRNGEKNVQIFPFGIGNDVNKQLLGLLADDNNGVVEFLENSDIIEKITDFYNTIRNPVLINATVEFDPDIIYMITPKKLPNLYKGSQMIVSGRYNTTEYEWLDVTLKGMAFGKEVEYNYTMRLANEYIEKNAVVPKIWAKQTIKDYLAEYYRYNENSDTAKIIKSKIQDLSVKYNILTQFTSFAGDNIIPVEFLSFNGYKTEQGIELLWETASEINNLGFYVERRNMTDKTEWEKITFVSGNGTKNTISRYNFTDKDVSINNLYEYRINQIDIDGTGTAEVYSTILSILFDNYYSLNLLQNYPNPMISYTNIDYYLPNSGNVTIEIYGIMGNLIEKPLDAIQNAGKYSFSYVPNKHLAPGAYYYILTFDNQKLMKTFIIE